MKTLFYALVFLLVSPTVSAEGGSYSCLPEFPNMEAIELSAITDLEYLVNGVDTVYLEDTETYRLDGFLGSLGDGSENYVVELFIDDKIFGWEKYGSLKMVVTLGGRQLLETRFTCISESSQADQ